MMFAKPASDESVPYVGSVPADSSGMSLTPLPADPTQPHLELKFLSTVFPLDDNAVFEPTPQHFASHIS